MALYRSKEEGEMTHLISCHTVYTAQGRVSSALYVTAHDANSL